MKEEIGLGIEESCWVVLLLPFFFFLPCFLMLEHIGNWRGRMNLGTEEGGDWAIFRSGWFFNDCMEI